MQVFICRDLIHLNIICVQIETVLSLIRGNWMLWLVGAGSKLAWCVIKHIDSFTFSEAIKKKSKEINKLYLNKTLSSVII